MCYRQVAESDDQSTAIPKGNFGAGWLVAALALTCCTSQGLRGASPSDGETCVDLVDLSKRGGVPSVTVEVNNVPVKMFFDTASPVLWMFPGEIPGVVTDGSEAYERGVWGKPVRMERLKPVQLRFGGRNVTIAEAERGPEQEVSWRYELAGILGLNVISAVGSEVRFEPPGRLCVSGPPCESPQKAWVTARSPLGEVSALVDSGVFNTRIFDARFDGATLVVPLSRTLTVTPTTAYQRATEYHNPVLDGRSVPAVIGWRSLREAAWRWGPCSGEFQFTNAGKQGG